MTRKMAQAIAQRHKALEAQTRAEQEAAQISIMACQIPHDAINAGLLKSIVVWRETRKTKQEWKAERKRDVQICKAPTTHKQTKDDADPLSDLLETHGKASYCLESDPMPYLRSYTYSSFVLALKNMNVAFASFQRIQCLDFSGQLLGDDRLAEACGGLRRCPLLILNLGFNNITDRGMTVLASHLRSLGNLQELNLAGNMFSDAGVQAIFENECYSPTLVKIDLSCNNLGPKSAYYLGLMFSSNDRVCRLDSLFLGGKVGKRGWGNDFVRVLVEHLCRHGARPLRRLSIPSAALFGAGISSVAALVATTTSLEVLNLTKNTLADAESCSHLRHALRINSSLKEFYYRQSGLSKAERDVLLFSWKSRYRVSWHEQIEIARCTAWELSKCAQMSYFVELELFNNWQTGKPLPWPLIQGTPPSDHDVEQDLMNASLCHLCSSMGLTKAILSMLASADSAAAFVLTLATCVKELQESAQGRSNDEMIVATQDVCLRRKGATNEKKLDLISALEKFSSVRVGKKEVTSTLAATSRRKKKEKAGTVGINTLLMSIEDYHTACIENGDAVEAHIGALFLKKMEREEAKGRMRSSHAPASAVAGRAAGNAAPPKRKLNAIPAFQTLGLAASYTYYLYNFAPAERDRARKSQLAFERDQKKLLDAEVKAAKKKVTSRRAGPRFQIIRRVKLEDEEDEDVEVEGEQEAEEIHDELMQELRRRDEARLAGAVETAVAIADADDKNSEEDGSGGGDVEESEEEYVHAREVTKFTVPKRDTQKKYGDLVIEDLTDSQAQINTQRQAMARGSRHMVARRLGMQAVLREDTRDVTFPVFFEVEYDRADAASRLPLLNTTRQNLALEVRIKSRNLSSQLVKEND